MQREGKTYRFLVFLIKYSHHESDFNASLAYMRSIMGENLPISLIFKTATTTLIQLHVREENTSAFLFSLITYLYRHHSIGFNASLSYIRSIMGEKLC